MNVTKNFIIGIITYNRYDYLDDLIKDIIRQNVWPKQIYISDNGIGYHLKEKIDIPITIIKNAYNYGTCRGTNEIIKLNQNEDILGDGKFDVIEDTSDWNESTRDIPLGLMDEE